MGAGIYQALPVSEAGSHPGLVGSSLQDHVHINIYAYDQFRVLA